MCTHSTICCELAAELKICSSGLRCVGSAASAAGRGLREGIGEI
jgi:hypothetical protein